MWLLDLEDPTGPDPIVYRAEIASVSVKAAHLSLNAFLIWIVCRAHYETREGYAPLAEVMGEWKSADCTHRHIHTGLPGDASRLVTSLMRVTVSACFPWFS